MISTVHFASVSPAVPNRPNDIVFPLSMRWPLTFWRWFFAPKPKPFVAPPGMGSEMSQGAYFVEGLGHCGECHTPRAVTMQVKATTPAQGAAYLSGAVIENYFAPSLRNGGPGTLGAWSEEELAQFLKTGANAQDNCAACHRPDGVGYELVFPRLAGNPVVQAGNPRSLISIVLEGSQTPRTARTPAQFTMPRFAWRLSDKDVADVVNFVRTSWGNRASPASSADVAKIRESLQPEH
jgi:mono/diheme cytochrome c family protein